MSHYFSKQPTSHHDLREITYCFQDREFTFVTDSNVFSKERIDLGSRTLLEALILPADANKILELGCGYGPLGIMLAAQNPGREVWMVDINERAVQLAKMNAERNGISNVHILLSDIFDAIPQEQFDLIFTNPPIRAGKEVVYQMFTEAAQHLTSRGELWYVIQKKQGSPSAERKVAELFPHVDEVTKEKGYRVYRAYY
ncbi:class I SAM-dependent methyltransferase [Rubeoparvulum massiliense]|uniref:class I SAM-dependent methyltransferase n=1 Tax=Rubeoparvulum massiliense TaxID=1631346 RepID=UPI00065DD206|nr:class I SAM-dependent methyltransferase [Rubeoparvulum massiliense]